MATNAEAALEILKKNVGNEEGVGDWFTVKQDQINLFADATLDHQFIHVDPEKSAQLSPYKKRLIWSCTRTHVASSTFSPDYS